MSERRHNQYLTSVAAFEYNKSLIETKIKQNEEARSCTRRNLSKNRKKIKQEFKTSMLKKTIKKARKVSRSKSRSKSRGKQLRHNLLKTQKTHLGRLMGIKNKLSSSYKRFIRDLQVSHTLQNSKNIDDLLKENHILK